MSLEEYAPVTNTQPDTLYIKCEWIILDDEKSLKICLNNDNIKNFKRIVIDDLVFERKE